MQKLLSPFKLIIESVSIYIKKENIVYLTLIYSILIPFQLFSYYQEPLIDFGRAHIDSNILGGIILAVNIIYFIIFLLTSVAGILAVKNAVSGNAKKYKETMTFAWKKVWGFFLLSALLILVILGGSILLLIPGMIFGIWFCFSSYIFVDQDLGIVASMKKSRALVKGRFWGVLYQLLILWIILGIVMFAINSIPWGIGSVLSTLLKSLFILPFFLLYKKCQSE